MSRMPNGNPAGPSNLADLFRHPARRWETAAAGGLPTMMRSSMPRFFFLHDFPIAIAAESRGFNPGRHRAKRFLNIHIGSGAENITGGGYGGCGVARLRGATREHTAEPRKTPQPPQNRSHTGPARFAEKRVWLMRAATQRVIDRRRQLRHPEVVRPIGLKPARGFEVKTGGETGPRHWRRIVAEKARRRGCSNWLMPLMDWRRIAWKRIRRARFRSS